MRLLCKQKQSDTPAFQQPALARALADVIRISVEKISRGETLDLNALRNKAAAMNGMLYLMMQNIGYIARKHCI